MTTTNDTTTDSNAMSIALRAWVCDLPSGLDRVHDTVTIADSEVPPATLLETAAAVHSPSPRTNFHKNISKNITPNTKAPDTQESDNQESDNQESDTQAPDNQESDTPKTKGRKKRANAKPHLQLVDAKYRAKVEFAELKRLLALARVIKPDTQAWPDKITELQSTAFLFASQADAMKRDETPPSVNLKDFIALKNKFTKLLEDNGVV